MRRAMSTWLVPAGVLLIAWSVCPTTALAQTKPAAADKVPITTTSDEARKLYLEGRDLGERFRIPEAVTKFQQAVAKDPNFALGYFGIATVAGSNKEFFEATTKAAALAPKASEGERHLILALEANMKGDTAGQETHLKQLVRLFPNDERAHAALGLMYFGRQDHPAAIEHLQHATKINPAFSQPYNQLGYEYSFLGRYPEAEQAFQKYISLIPNDPNPYDSYAELLMKTGRFAESIKTYEKALAMDAHFTNAYVGIGNNHQFMGHPAEARASFAKLQGIARTTAERRTAALWTATSYVDEGATDKALEELKKAYVLAEADGDAATMAADHNIMGDVLREAGRYDDALKHYMEAVAVIEKSQVPADVKRLSRQNALFEQGRVAAARNDVATAKARAADYSAAVAAAKRPVDIRQQHELMGLIAMAEKNATQAVQEFKQADQQDPRVVFLTAQAYQAAGDAQQARAMAKKAAEFNALNPSYAFVRNKAKKLAPPS